jgi:hypothetical protein
MEWVEWSVSWSTAADDGVCWGFPNDIHLVAFPIAMISGGRGVSEDGRERRGRQCDGRRKGLES